MIEKIPRNEVLSVVWDGGRPVRREGLFGPLIDRLFGQRVIPGKDVFIATREDGSVLTSPDGTTWTARSTPQGDTQ